MKKTIIVLSMLLVTMGASIAADIQPNHKDRPLPPHRISKEDMAKREAAFDQRLGLTEEQKQQAKDLRIKGHEKMKPIMEDLFTKKQEARKLQQKKFSGKKLKKLNTEIQELEKQAREIRRTNMKDFEAILTPEQKATLKEMKKEGRKNFQKARKEKPVMPKKEFSK